MQVGDRVTMLEDSSSSIPAGTKGTVLQIDQRDARVKFDNRREAWVKISKLR